MIEIVLENGDVKRWYPDEYTEYDIKGRFLVVIKDTQWIGMYGINQIVSLEVR